MTIEAIVNGVRITQWELQSDGTYKANATAPSESTFLKTPQYYNVSITATNEFDNSTTIDASDSTWGTACQLKVKEKFAPKITVMTPQSGSLITTNTFVIRAEAYDNDNGQTSGYSGIKSLELYLDGTKKTVTTTDVGNYGMIAEATFTDLPEGNHSYYWVATDNDGNVTTSEAQSFVTDYALPSLTITSPSANFKHNKQTIKVSGTTDGEKYLISVNGTPTVTYENAKSVVGGVIDEDVTLREGANSIVITVWDNNKREYSTTINGTMSLTAPEFVDVRIVPNPADGGATYSIIVKVR